MRRIHPVAPLEKFVASGTYRHLKNNEPTGYVEHWSIHEQPDGAWFIRVDKDGREFDQRSILVEVWGRQRASTIERFDISAYGTPDDRVQKARVTYTFEDRTAFVSGTINETAQKFDETLLPPDARIYPGCSLFDAQLIAEQATVFSYVPGFTATNAFSGYLLRASTILEGTEVLTVSGKVVEAQRYRLTLHTGSRVDLETLMWLDANQIPVRHHNPSSDLTIRLERYAHRPEPKN